MVALSLSALIGAVGLALDAGLSYTVKAKLNAATDSASLAAARAVATGDNLDAQIANAKAAAKRFFDVNYPANYMLAHATMNEPSVVSDGHGKFTIDVSASATMPVSLLGALGAGPLAPAVGSQTVRKDLDMVLVLDTSGSLSDEASSVRSSATTFLKQFNVDQDRVGLLHFAYGAVIDDPIRPLQRGFDRTSMTNHINAYRFAGSTASPEGMWNARDQINGISLADRSSLRVIVFFSDGSPNSFGSYLDFKTPSDCTQPGTITTDDDGSGTPGGLYRLDRTNSSLGGGCTPSEQWFSTALKDKVTALPDWYNAHNPVNRRNDPLLREYPIVTSAPRVVTNVVNYTNVNRAARNLVEAMASKSRDEGIYVFTLGLGAQLKSGTGVDNEKGEDTLKCMANSVDSPSRCFNAAKPVGVYCYAATESDLTPCFSKLASAILRITK